MILVTMSLWNLVEKYCDETGATEASVLRRAGLNKGTFTAWRARGIPQLPSRGQLIGLADALRLDYATVLDAVLHDALYLPETAARREQERIDAALYKIDFRRRATVEKHVQDLLSDTANNVAEAIQLNDELGADGSIRPGVHDQAAALLKAMSDPASTTEDALAAHDEEGSIAGEQEQPTEP